jgi:DNA-binding LytR/AlgR family response regulator
MKQEITEQSHPVLVVRGALYFICQRRRMKIGLHRITHISATTPVVEIFTLGRRYETNYHLSDIWSQLPPTQFYRVHPLHIVALSHVHMLDGKEVLVGDARLFTTAFYRGPLSEALDRRRVIPQVSYKNQRAIRNILL